MRSNALPRLEGEPEFEKGLATTRELLPVQDHMVHIKGACIIAMRKSLAMRASSVCPFVCYIRGQCSVGLNLISHYIPRAYERLEWGGILQPFATPCLKFPQAKEKKQTP